MASACPSCSVPLSTLQKVLGVRPFQFVCPSCNARLETREALWSGLLANVVAQVVFIIVAVEAFGNLHVGFLWSVGIGGVASSLVLVVPVVLFGRVELREK